MALSMSAATRCQFRQTFRAPTAARSANRTAVRRTLVVRADKDPGQAAKDAGKDIKEGLKGAVSEGEKKLENLSDKAGDVLSDARGEASKAESKAKDAGRDVKGSAKDTANKAESEGKSLGDKIKGGLADAADAVKGKADEAKKNIK